MVPSRLRSTTIAASAVIILAACAAQRDVTPLSADTIPTDLSTSESVGSPSNSEDATADPSTPTTDPDVSPNDPDSPRLPPPTGDGLLFELDEMTIEVTNRSMSVDTPPDGYDGFMSAVRLADGSFVASGFDARFEGGQPERSALWTSRDGSSWERVGDSVGSSSGQQHIAALYLNDDRVHALETQLGVRTSDGGTPTIDFGLTVEWTSDDGTGWGSAALVGNNMISGVESIDGEIVGFGAARPNRDGEYVASIVRPPAGGGDWTAEEITDTAGTTFRGSFITDMHAVGDTILAVGATGHTDPLSDQVGTLQDVLFANSPSDVGIWRSTDSASTWEFLETDSFAGRSGPAHATDLVELDGSLFMLTTTVEAYQTTVTLHRSDDLGETWERVRFERALASDVGNNTDLSNVGLYALDGYLVVLEERFGGWQNMFMSIIDPVTGDSVTHSITEQLRVVQVEEILDVADGALGFGRIENGPAESDLQVIDIREVDSSVAAGDIQSADTTTEARPPEDTVPVTAEQDPFGFRRARPRAAAGLDMRWTIDSPGFVLQRAVATDEVVVYSTIDTGNTQRVYAVDRETGAALWDDARADRIVVSMEIVDGVIVIDWGLDQSDWDADGRNNLAVGYDASTGKELWTVGGLDGYFDLEPPSSEYVVRSLQDDQFDYTVLEPATGAVVGSYVPVGSSPDNRVGAMGPDLVELDAATLAPVGDPIPTGLDLHVQADVAVLANRVVIAGLDVLDVLDRSGALTARIPFPTGYAASVLPVRPDSNQVVVTANGEVAGFDADVLAVRWVAPGEHVESFGYLDGEMHGLIQTADSAELVSLETGRPKCTLDGVRNPVLLRHGFFDGETAYGSDCTSLWTAPEGDVQIVDKGVLRSRKVDGRVEITLHE